DELPVHAVESVGLHGVEVQFIGRFGVLCGEGHNLFEGGSGVMADDAVGNVVRGDEEARVIGTTVVFVVAEHGGHSCSPALYSENGKTARTPPAWASRNTSSGIWSTGRLLMKSAGQSSGPSCQVMAQHGFPGAVM